MEKNVLSTDLTGEVAVVTGAGGVLCSALAKALARAGAKVALLNRSMESTQKYSDEIIAEGGIAKAYQCNVLEKDTCLAVAEQVLKDFARHVAQEDVQHFADVFVTAKRTGGDSIAILKSSIRTISDKIEVERQIQTMLASKKLEFQIMCVVPLGMMLYMRFSFFEFLSVLYGNTLGVLVMTVCLAVYIAAYRIGKKIIQIEV